MNKYMNESPHRPCSGMSTPFLIRSSLVCLVEIFLSRTEKPRSKLWSIFAIVLVSLQCVKKKQLKRDILCSYFEQNCAEVLHKSYVPLLIATPILYYIKLHHRCQMRNYQMSYFCPLASVFELENEKMKNQCALCLKSDYQ